MKFHSVGVVSRGRTDGLTDRQTYITKLIVAFRKFEKALKINLNISVFMQISDKTPSAQDFYSEDEGDMFRQYT